MNITREEKGTLSGQIKMAFDESDYQERVKNILNDYRRKASIPGFRPGKVPMGMIKKMYGTSVLAEEVNKLLSEKLNEYITEEKLQILGYPIPAEDTPQLDFDNETSFEFVLDIGYSPEINIEYINDMTFDYYKIKADDAMIQKHIQTIREQFGEHIPVDSFEKEDLVSCLIEEVNEDGEIVEEALTTEQALPFNDNKEAEEKFVGLKKDDTITLVPNDLFGDDKKHAFDFIGIISDDEEKNDDDLAKQYRFTVKDIKRLQPAELNAELFEKVFPKAGIETEEAFIAKDVEQAEKSFVPQTDMFFVNTAITSIVEKADFELPTEFLKRWVNQNMYNNLKEGEKFEPLTEEAFVDVVKSFRWELLQNKLVEKYGIKVEEEDVKRAIKLFFIQQYMPHISAEEVEAQMPQLEQLANSILKDEKQNKDYYEKALNEKMIQAFKKEFTLDIKDVSIDEFSEIVQPKEKIEEVVEEVVEEEITEEETNA